MTYKYADSNAAIGNTYAAQGGKAVNYNSLNESNRWLNLLGDAALIGGGIGVSWAALKKLVETAYRSRLEKAIREGSDIQDAYEHSDMPVDSTFVAKTAMRKRAKNDVVIRDRDMNKGYVSSDIRADGKPGSSVILAPGQGTRTDLTSTMATTPAVWNSLALALSPLVLGGAMWGGSHLTKYLAKNLASDKAESLDEERRKARKRFENAAKMLRGISTDREEEQ